jgi:hypothetical protein
MVEKTQAEQRVLEAAREWLTELSPETKEEKALFIAVARCWPEEMAGKEACGCGEQEACGECASASEIEAHLQRLERELATTQDAKLCV